MHTCMSSPPARHCHTSLRLKYPVQQLTPQPRTARAQIRKIYEPDKYCQGDGCKGGGYGGAKALPLFEKHFGPAPRCHVCSIGFEPNPNHGKRLDEVETRLRAAGAGVLIFRVAAGAADGTMKFAAGSGGDRNAYWTANGSPISNPTNFAKIKQSGGKESSWSGLCVCKV